MNCGNCDERIEEFEEKYCRECQMEHCDWCKCECEEHK